MRVDNPERGFFLFNHFWGSFRSGDISEKRDSRGFELQSGAASAEGLFWVVITTNMPRAWRGQSDPIMETIGISADYDRNPGLLNDLLSREGKSPLESGDRLLDQRDLPLCVQQEHLLLSREYFRHRGVVLGPSTVPSILHLRGELRPDVI